MIFVVVATVWYILQTGYCQVKKTLITCKYVQNLAYESKFVYYLQIQHIYA